MSVKVSWTPDLSVPISSFLLNVSTDKGETFNLLTSIPFNTAPGSSNYDQKTKQFFYIDAGGVAGNIYQVIVIGSDGTSIPEHTIAPPTAYPMCTIFGYLIDAFGNVDMNQTVFVRSYGTRGERWAHNVPGIVSQNPMGIGVSDASRTVFPDNNGIWQIALVQGVYVKVEIPSIEFIWVFEVPAEPGPVNIRDIKQLRGEDLGIYPEMLGERSRFPES